MSVRLADFSRLTVEAQMQGEDALRLVDQRPWSHVGSSSFEGVADPADVDLLVLAAIGDGLSSALAGAGFELESAASYKGRAPTFASWRSGLVNVLVTQDPKFFLNFNLAHDLAIRFGLTEKADRVALFQAVLYQKAAR